MNKRYIIYLHRNKINGKCYVGQTCQKPEARWGLNGSNYKKQELFYKAIIKYGWDNFDHIILETNITEDKVNEREAYWGGYYHALAPEGYSLSFGAGKSYASSEISSQNRSKASSKKWQDEDYREKVSKGRKQMWETASQPTKNKMLANLDKTGKGAKATSKKVLCVETGVVYNSTREAERKTNINHCNISQVCTGQRKTAGKFHWRYI